MTETTQPDPQVVAWMRGHQAERPITNASIAIRAWLTTHGFDTLADSPHSLRELSHAYYAAARKPLAVADVPAGQGVASLFLMRSERWGGSFPVLFYRDENGHPRPIHRPGVGGYPEGVDALWDHLAATLRHVTAEETP